MLASAVSWSILEPRRSGTRLTQFTLQQIFALFYRPIKPHCSPSKTRKLSIQYNGANSFLSSRLLFLLGTSTLHFIKYYRNTIYGHAEQASVGDVTFNDFWCDIRDTLVRLGGVTYAAAVDSLKDKCMDPQVEDHYKELLRQWKKDEDSVKEQLDQIKEKLEMLEFLAISKEDIGK